MKRKLFPLLGIFYFLTVSVQAQLTVNTTQTPTQLVQNVLLGAGVQVSNISYTGAADAKGSFNCNNCGVGFTDGVLLTSGSVFVAPGPNGGTGAGQSNGLGGDPDLAALVTPYPSQDACVLEFDFSVASDSVEFRYVFASDEYNDYVNSNFNDVFAFFISGPGFTGQQNIAIIPGTTTPVSINNVNNGFAPAGQNSSGPCTNCTYFQDNANPATATINVEYDGLTTILTARAAVSPCEQYHIKLAISDVQDHIFDSGVFLEANSFTSFGQVSIIADTTQFNGVVSNDTVYVCPGESAVLCSPPAQNILWSTGDTTQCVTVSQPGNYSMFIYLGSCFAWSNTITVVIDTPQAVITPAGPVTLPLGGSDTLCANTGSSYLWSNGATTQCIIVNTANTYTVSVTNFTGCTASTTVLVVDCNAGGGTPSVNISGTTNICTGASTLLIANAVNFTPAGYLWSTGDTISTVSISNAGTYTVTVSGACGSSLTTSVNITSGLPSVNITGNSVVCPGANTILTANSATAINYVWSTGASTAPINVSVGTYTVTVTDANGCTATVSNQVTPTSSPSPVITGISSICSGSNTSIDAGSGFLSYVWSSGASTQNINVSSGGTYTVTVTDANGCTGTDSFVLSVNSNPAPSIIGPTDICMGDNAVYALSNSYSAYVWSTGSNSNNITVNTSGNYTVTVTDANGCSGSTQQNLQVHTLPSPSITGNNIICDGNTSVFDAGAGYSNYLWSNGSTNQITNVSVAQIYTVTVTDVFGCSNYTDRQLIVNQNPVPSITGVNIFCDGNSSIIDAGVGYSQYVWSNGNSTQSINVNSSGTYVVTVTDANGCTGTSSLVITVNTLPTPTIVGPTDICDGDVATLNTSMGYASYMWSTGQNANSISVSGSGSYTVTVTDANGCTGSTQQQVTSHNLPTPIISGQNIICDGDMATLNAGAGYSQYVWSNGATAQSISISQTSSHMVTVTDLYGCTGTSPPHDVLVDVPLANINALGPLEFCDNENVTLVANNGSSFLWSNGSTLNQLTTNTSGLYAVTVTDSVGCKATSAPVAVKAHFTPIVALSNEPIDLCDKLRVGFINNSQFAPGSTIEWSFGDGMTSSSINPVHTYLNPGTYNVTLTITGQFGCKDKDSIEVTVDHVPYPEAYFEMSSDMVTIFNSKIEFTDLSLNTVSWHWTFGDGINSKLQNPVHHFDHEGMHTVTLIVENSVGCVDVYSREVFVTPFYIPNAFSPNGDGINDYFFIGDYIFDVRSFNMYIFNRWGDLAYESDSYRLPWNGKMQDGFDAPQGSYVYMLEVETVNGVKHLYKGNLTLIR